MIPRTNTGTESMWRSFHRSKKLLMKALQAFLLARRRLSQQEYIEARDAILGLYTAIRNKDRPLLTQYKQKVTSLLKETLFPSFIDRAIAFGKGALMIGVIIVGIRPMVFELYEVPTGSMRPTIEEEDRLLVSKSAYGINMPLVRNQFYFDPELLQHNNIVVFTAEGLDMPNATAKHFNLIPGYKQVVKRAIGRPGDRLYFYGGRVFGIDREGHDITPLLNSIPLEHIPFISFEGRVRMSSPRKISFYQMNLLAGSIENSSSGLKGSVGKDLTKKSVHDIYDAWGIKNYGDARIVSTKYAQGVDPRAQGGNGIVAFLEIAHHPSILKPTILSSPEGKYPSLGRSFSYLPLERHHLETLFSHMVTSRFVVTNKKASPYRYETVPSSYHQFDIPFDIADGTYEYDNGVAYEIKQTGIRKRLEKDHPLCQFSIEKTILLYNLGIHWNSLSEPKEPSQSIRSSRFVYFRDGDIYAMNTPLMPSSDPILQSFVSREVAKRDISSEYTPFIDSGKPSLELISSYGISVPERSYLVLGDNYANSADSRDFGFLPEQNIRGAPSFIFYPFGSRFGSLPQGSSRILTLPHIIVWTPLLLWLLYALYQNVGDRKLKRLLKELEEEKSA